MVNQNVVLLSYPRSGNTFTRYMLEYLTGLSSIGYLGNLSSLGAEIPLINKKITKPIIKKLHGLNDNEMKYIKNVDEDGGSLLLLLRDPLECFIRDLGIETTSELFYSIARGECNMFFSNLKIYDEFKSKKKIVFYEEMINNPKQFMLKISQFFELPKSNMINNFMKKFESHKQNSLRAYSIIGESKTQGNNKSYHLDKILANESNSGLGKDQLMEIIVQMVNGIDLSDEVARTFLNAYGEVHEK